MAVVYSRLTMRRTTVTAAGSRMTSFPTISTLPRLGRFALLATFSVLSFSIIGAARAGADNASHRDVQKNIQPKQTSPRTESASVELMHEIAPAPTSSQEPVTLASAVLPVAAVHTPRIVMMQVTAYCPCTRCCGPHARGLTASGKPVSFNGGQFVAADTRLFKFGTTLQIPGYADGAPVEVVDKGGAIKGNHLDVFFPTHEQAKEWGRKWIAVTVVE